VRKTFFVIAIILLAGCAGFRKEALSPARTASEFESRKLTSAEFREYLEQNRHREAEQWPPQSWDFNLLVLAALYYHPDMEVARARGAVTDAAVVTAGGRPNPHVSLLGQHHSDTPGGSSVWTWGASFDIPIETAGKRGYRSRRAEHLADAARLQIVETAWKVRSRLKQSLLSLYLSEKEEDFLKCRLSLQGDIAAIFEKRVEEGETSQFEATQAHLALDRIRLQLAETKKQNAEARASVAQALGIPLAALEEVRISFDVFEHPPPPVSLQETRFSALSHRADILASFSDYEAAQSNLQLEIAKQYPDLHIGPGYEWDQGDNKWSLGFALELPVFNRNKGPIEEARAKRKEAAAKFRALQSEIIGRIDKAETAYSEALKKLEVAEAVAEAGESHLLIVLRRFDSGEADRLAREEARLEASSAESARFEALVSAQEGLGMLEDAVQEPLAPPEFFPLADEGAHGKGPKR
jgi:cobalt-zinc-cadmium efflux system outer membrane protein